MSVSDPNLNPACRLGHTSASLPVCREGFSLWLPCLQLWWSRTQRIFNLKIPYPNIQSTYKTVSMHTMVNYFIWPISVFTPWCHVASGNSVSCAWNGAHLVIPFLKTNLYQEDVAKQTSGIAPHPNICTEQPSFQFFSKCLWNTWSSLLVNEITYPAFSLSSTVLRLAAALSRSRAQTKLR